MNENEIQMGDDLPSTEEYTGKCSSCGKNCYELFSGQCDTCFLEEQYYGGGIVVMFDPNPGGDEF